MSRMSRSAAPPVARLTIRADTRATRQASSWLAAAADTHDVPAEAVTRLDHCLDEALANVVAHGGPAATASPVELDLAVRRKEGACSADLTLRYQGVAFDPCDHEPAPRPTRLADAPLGGLGVSMLRHFSDAIDYARENGRNRLRITVSWTDPA